MEIGFNTLAEGHDVDCLQFAYQAIDPLFGTFTWIRLEKLEGEKLSLYWFYDPDEEYYKTYIHVFYRPKVSYFDPSNPDNKRKTTAMFVLDVWNWLDVKGDIIIDRYETPLKAKEHYIVVIGAELTGLRGYEVVWSSEMP